MFSTTCTFRTTLIENFIVFRVERQSSEKKAFPSVKSWNAGRWLAVTSWDKEQGMRTREMSDDDGRSLEIEPQSSRLIRDSFALAFFFFSLLLRSDKSHGSWTFIHLRMLGLWVCRKKGTIEGVNGMRLIFIASRHQGIASERLTRDAIKW